MDPFTLSLILAGSFGAGILGAMLGLGGGFILIPFLTLALGLPMQVAIGASITAVIATSSAGTVYYVDQRLTNMKLGMVLEVATTVGAIVGASLATIVDPRALGISFSLLLVYGAYTMLRHLGREGRQESESRLEPSQNTELGSSYFDVSRNEQVEYSVSNLPTGMVASFFAGNMSGLLGVGGGIVKVPVMRVIMGVPMQAAVATSSFMIGVTGLASACVYFSRGFIDLGVAGPAAIGTLLGALLGSKVARRTKGRTLSTLFIAVMLYFSLHMMLKALGIVA